VQVIGNTVHGAEMDGIRLVNADGVIVRHNTVTQTENAGIQLFDDVKHARVVRNVVLTDGIDLVNSGGKSNCFRRNEHDTHEGWIHCRP
jgi:parallel beta-helix repeat protein